MLTNLPEKGIVMYGNCHYVAKRLRKRGVAADAKERGLRGERVYEVFFR